MTAYTDFASLNLSREPGARGNYTCRRGQSRKKNPMLFQASDLQLRISIVYLDNKYCFEDKEKDNRQTGACGQGDHPGHYYVAHNVHIDSRNPPGHTHP
jgi:hypothetical protein